MMRWAALWICAVWLSGCAHGVGPARTAERLQQLQTELAQIDQGDRGDARSGYVLKVRAHGELVFSQQVGLAALATQEPIHDETAFELASLSKIFTAVAVMQLQEQGWLALDQALSHYLPGLPQAWQGITVHHLLSHQSGLPDLINQWPRRPVGAVVFEDMMAHFRQHPQLEFEPASQAAYSNTNYILLAELVARVSGEDFGAYLRRHVFEPANMTSSAVSTASPKAAEKMALPYASAGKTHDMDFAVLGAINQKSTLLDLENFLQALLQHKLLRPQTLDVMLKPHAVFADGKRYGYGWYIGRLGGWAAMSTSLPAAGVGHTGRMGAYRTALYFNRERQFQLIMLSNGGLWTEKLLVNFLQTTRDLLE
jgi:CubicO group peptidase (beta-lactamase class C family)